VAVAAQGEESAGLPATSAAGAALGAELYAPIARDEGVRIGLVGDSGTGKTTAARYLLADWISRFPGIALVHDDTGPRQFVGQERADVAELRRLPIAPSPRVVVFRGHQSLGIGADPEPIAGLGWRLVRRRPPTPALLLFDELERSARGGRWNHPASCPSRRRPPLPCTCELPRVFSWGRRSCLSCIWTTQSPQSAPLEALEQSSTLLVFHMAGLGLGRLRKLDYVNDQAERAIVALPDMYSADRGAFIKLRRGVPWDGRVLKM